MRIIAIVGPTATGKSELALDLADALRAEGSSAELTNADAMQLYRGMDVGTAKTPPTQRRGVPHHQLDVLDVTQEASVAAYQTHARADLAAVRARGAWPLLVGGSGLYVRSVLDDLTFPDTDPAVRRDLEERGERLGPGLLHDELARVDPLAAQRIGRHNLRRLVRALEVIALTGEPYSANLPDHTYALDAVQLAIRVERAELDERIHARTAAMFTGGLLEETRDLLDHGLERGVTASRAVGYAQAIDVVRGRLHLEDAVAAAAVATRQVARRQDKWFRRDPRVRWLDPEGDLLAQARAVVESAPGSGAGT
ncbi:tRNA delta(2)-isopentenylpyrophosphate transferase [Beutenbergia cavernae DSM 12333]|uniref:tRNA dimethylallyltransferase n=1 Tax=Beutenbergia cavernae (strain ATCC BAA-8 / DSM 12333 / CCUG 43141 / JCM 11478 / NBRC 16432 / NCIMB 13614 / HKI 0122) TaxID=471853 RepID=C5BWM3_BEUC1|nr:tRNA (adenosine(37)-N6)-dimethylallyltransferase MiaA [Beutenbergia cavernae]ACQ80689.1 tRNA delta(2)-isopentenylpyrophosphate transferase [Beutenbergia cavernae DSM 12333]